MARFLGRVWRASEKITTNRTKDVDPETGETLSPLWRYQWCGFKALRWCQERGDRFIEMRFRSTEDWVMPDSPYSD